VDESSLSLHKVEFVVDAGEDFCDSSGVGDHADCAHDLGEVTSRDYGRRLLIDAALEAGRAPVDELDGSLGLDGCNSSVDILRNDVASLHQAACHVFAVTRVALSHHGCRLERGVGDLCN